MKLDKEHRAAPGRLDAARAAALGARPQVRRARRPAPARRDLPAGADDPGTPGAPARSWSWTTSSTCSTRRRASASATRSTASAAASPAGARTSTRRSTAFVPLLDDLEPVAQEPVGRRTRGSNRFFASLGARGAGGGAGGRGAGVAVREPRHVVHGAGAVVARPVPPGDDLGEPAQRGSSRSRTSRCQRPFIRNSAAFFRELRPGVAMLPHAAPDARRRLRGGHGGAAEDEADEQRPRGRVREARRVRPGLGRARGRRPAHAAVLLAPQPTLAFLTPAQTTCNYGVDPASATWRACSPRATRTAPSSASSSCGAPLDKFTFELGKNNEAGPSAALANGPQQHNHLHVNMYPNTATPGPDARVRGG